VSLPAALPVPGPSANAAPLPPAPVVVQTGGPMPSSAPMPTIIETKSGPESGGTLLSADQETVRDLMARNSTVEVMPPGQPLTVPPALPEAMGRPAETTNAVDRPGSLLRVVNTRQISFSFDVKDVNSSGLSGLEVWSTLDGRTWNKCECREAGRTCVVEVEREGMYGFTMLARNAVGVSKQPPHSGDSPQVWVIVDETAPAVGDVRAELNRDSKPRTVAVTWKAVDQNLRRNSITLLSAASEAGPWKVIAANLENTGQYLWTLPNDAPVTAVIRVEATDLAGNIGRAQTAASVPLDNRVPEVIIEGVEPGGSKPGETPVP
jgi:hypothetical protein